MGNDYAALRRLLASRWPAWPEPDSRRSLLSSCEAVLPKAVLLPFPKVGKLLSDENTVQLNPAATPKKG